MQNQQLNQQPNMTTTTTIVDTPKFTAGAAARREWAQPEALGRDYSAVDYDAALGGVLRPTVRLVLDDDEKRQTTLKTQPIGPAEAVVFNDTAEVLYAIVRNGRIVKIGGSRNGMKSRWASYLCGHHVAERGKSGKMSVTNAFLYHTIEQSLLNGDEWEIWVHRLPRVAVVVDVFGVQTEVEAQVFHKYEAAAMAKFEDLAGFKPGLSANVGTV